jgi:hypothetical protein
MSLLNDETMKRKVSLYIIDSRIEDDERKWSMWTCTLRVMDVYRQQKSLLFSFQFDLIIDRKMYNEYFLLHSKIVCLCRSTSVYNFRINLLQCFSLSISKTIVLCILVEDNYFEHLSCTKLYGIKCKRIDYII